VSVERLDTERLAGTRVAATDLDRLRSLYQDPRVAETLGGMRTDEWIAERLAFELGHWSEHGFGAWVFVDRGSGAFVGRGAVRHAQIAGLGSLDGDQIELGYALRPEYWGRGLATEMARAMVVVARDGIRLPELAAWTLTTNRASQQVLEKTGFVYQRDFEYAGSPHRYYRLDLAARPSSPESST
jgi:RimJ/RimL family protein N-acetyltransferase